MGGLKMKAKENQIEKKHIPYMPPTYKSYSVDEVLAAGGATAFAVKMGKSLKGLKEELAALPPESFLTDEEFETALAMLRESK
jgi:hypothetical protein